MITSLLVANRGEIARRVVRSARDRGLATVAVFSDPDADAPFVVEADSAVRLPGSSSAETYLRRDLLIDAAQRAGADAIHPGYGFLSENADFAQAVLDAGLTWVGPSPAAIRLMGSKTAAKQAMAEVGVPVLDLVAVEDVTQADLPLLIKASAGGGGRGMRIVRTLADLEPELARARSEAAAAFGDDSVFCEPYLAAGRHIEVQVLADRHGTVWTLPERECSLQRRHQKVIEEAPSPLVESIPGMRERLFDAARAAAKAIDYEGAGTVEFIADSSGRFFFLEMNTRLQVEHPVTEAVTGLDLVDWQLAIADGAHLPAAPPEVTGHSIEARLYAEDPERDWQPQSGVLHRIELPGVTSRFNTPDNGRPWLRLDSGVENGATVSVHYDPMLAKLISWAPDRAGATRLLAAALARAEIHGLITNRDLLVGSLRHADFRSGNTDTGFFDRIGMTELAGSTLDEHRRSLTVLAAALADAAANRNAAPGLRAVTPGWRNVRSQLQRKTYRVLGGPELAVTYGYLADGVSCPELPDVQAVAVTPNSVTLDDACMRTTFTISRYNDTGDSGGGARGGGATVLVAVDSALGSLQLQPVPRFSNPAEAVTPGSLIAPMPGAVVSVDVRVGQQVTAGEVLLVVEAMKMQHTISAPSDGTVSELAVAPGTQVDQGAVLAVVTPDASNISD